MSETLEVQGSVIAVHGNNNYVVDVIVDYTTRRLPCYCSGKLNRFRINIIPGDEVTVVIPGPTYDRGRIIFRGEKRERAVGQRKRGKR